MTRKRNDLTKEKYVYRLTRNEQRRKQFTKRRKIRGRKSDLATSSMGLRIFLIKVRVTSIRAEKLIVSREKNWSWFREKNET